MKGHIRHKVIPFIIDLEKCASRLCNFPKKIILCASCLGLAALNVSQIKTPKLSGNPVNVYALAIYTLAITGIYGWKLL